MLSILTKLQMESHNSKLTKYQQSVNFSSFLFIIYSNFQINEGQRDARPKQRKRRSRDSIRMPDDITREELDNVADRAKDKILDKENVLCFLRSHFEVRVTPPGFLTCVLCVFRAARVISVVRRPSTRRQNAGGRTARGSKVSFAARVCATVTEKTFARPCWIP